MGGRIWPGRSRALQWAVQRNTTGPRLRKPNFMSPILGSLGGDTLKGHDHGLYGTVGVEFHTIQADDPVVPVQIGDGPSMVDHDPLVLPGALDHGMVPGPCGDVPFLGFQDGPDAFVGPGRPVRYGIGDLITAIGPVALGPHEIINALAQEHKRSLHITLRGDLPKQASILPGNETRKVVV